MNLSNLVDEMMKARHLHEQAMRMFGNETAGYFVDYRNKCQTQYKNTQDKLISYIIEHYDKDIKDELEEIEEEAEKIDVDTDADIW